MDRARAAEVLTTISKLTGGFLYWCSVAVAVLLWLVGAGSAMSAVVIALGMAFVHFATRVAARLVAPAAVRR